MKVNIKKAGLSGVWESIPESLRRLLKYLPPYRAKMAVSVFFMLLAGVASSLIAALLGKITDLGFYNQSPWIILAAPLGLVAVSVLHGLSMFMSNYLLGKVSQSVLVTLRRELFHNILRWPAVQYQQNQTGVITSKFVFEANFALGNAAKSCIILIRDTCQVLALSIVLFWHNWTLAVVSLVIGPFVLLLLRYIANKLRSVMSSSQANIAQLLVRVKEAYEGERLIKISNTYQREEERFVQVNETISRLMTKMARVGSLGTPVTQLICMAGVAVVLAIAMVQTQQGLLTLGEFVTFLAALLLIMPPLRHLAGLNASFVMMRVAAESIFAILDIQPEEDTGKTVLEHCQGRVEFQSVSLRYPGTTKDAVHAFSLTAHRGESIALVGLSGSGKTSVIHMIPRLWTPTQGRILIDGHDVRDITLESLRRQIAVVSQDVFLFDDTIRNNIAYGLSHVDDEAMDRAVRDAALTELVGSLPRGLDTPVGEAGDKLSGGQRQRISIARALLKNAPILILDEATSALDSVNEAQIKQALERLMQGRTTFVVAHRLSTIDNVTKIVVMGDGNRLEEGTMTELLANPDGRFTHLYQLQNSASCKELQ